MRQATLKTFRSENLDVSWTDLRQRIKDELKEGSKEEIFQKSWDKICEIAAELLDIILEETSPIHKIPKYWRKLLRVFGIKKSDTSPGATDLMQRLLEKLRKENDLFKELDRTYREAMSELDRISKPTTK
jgi:GTP1/Obg family GTP-binding protein